MKSCIMQVASIHTLRGSMMESTAAWRSMIAVAALSSREMKGESRRLQHPSSAFKACAVMLFLNDSHV